MSQSLRLIVNPILKKWRTWDNNSWNKLGRLMCSAEVIDSYDDAIVELCHRNFKVKKTS